MLGRSVEKLGLATAVRFPLPAARKSRVVASVELRTTSCRWRLALRIAHCASRIAYWVFVRAVGLEPTSGLRPPEPKSGAYANSATPAEVGVATSPPQSTSVTGSRGEQNRVTGNG